jgi:transketolase
MPTIHFIPKVEFDRLLALPADPPTRAKLVATACRINVLYMICRAGSGHVGTSFSCLDAITWLHLNELTPADVCFSSKGHDAPAFYALHAALGRVEYDKIHHLRRLDGLPGHPDVGTPGTATNTGSLGMGISKAKGMVHANRLQGRKANVFVILGDGELQEGQNWESLTSAVRYGMGELTAVVDQNKIQSDTWTCDVSDLGDVAAKFRAFGWEATACDGHDPAALRDAFAQLKRITDRPKVLVADTLKGKGVSFMEPAAMDPAERMYKFHSGAPPQEAYEKGFAELLARANALLAEVNGGTLRTEPAERVKLPTPPNPQRLVRAYSEALVAQAEKNPKLVVLDADLVLDCGLIPFARKFPDRFFECGIAEQDMVSTAGGMALRGLVPVAHSFACFLAPRPNEQIYNNATERTKVVYVGSLAGLIPGGPGHSHQSVRDISILAATPGMVLIEPCTEAEVALALDYCVNTHPGSSYIRLVSVGIETPFTLPAGYALKEGRGVALRDGPDAAFVGYGPALLTEACRAADELAAAGGPRVAVYNLPWLNRVDDGWLRDVAAKHSVLLLLDNHYTAGGQGQMLAARLAELDVAPRPRVVRLGVTRVPHCGTNPQVLAAHGLDANGLAAAARREVRG